MSNKVITKPTNILRHGRGLITKLWCSLLFALFSPYPLRPIHSFARNEVSCGNKSFAGAECPTYRIVDTGEANIRHYLAMNRMVISSVMPVLNKFIYHLSQLSFLPYSPLNNLDVRLKARLHMRFLIRFLMRFRVQNAPDPTLHESLFREASCGLERKVSHIILRHPSFEFLPTWR